MSTRPPNRSQGGEEAGELFAALRGLLLAHRARLSLVHDVAGHVYANCVRPDGRGKPVFFGAVKTSGRKQIFHLMPVYDYPELLVGISPALRRRMQGKSCFNFEALDSAVLAELEGLVAKGVERYRDDGKM